MPKPPKQLKHGLQSLRVLRRFPSMYVLSPLGRVLDLQVPSEVLCCRGPEVARFNSGISSSFLIHVRIASLKNCKTRRRPASPGWSKCWKRGVREVCVYKPILCLHLRCRLRVDAGCRDTPNAAITSVRLGSHLNHLKMARLQPAPSCVFSKPSCRGVGVWGWGVRV